MITIGYILLATIPLIGVWFAAKLHFEADAVETLTAIKKIHEKRIVRVMESAYAAGYKDGQRGDVYAGGK